MSAARGGGGKKENLSLSTREKSLMKELRELNSDYGGFTTDQIPMIKALAKGYGISPERAVNMAKTLKGAYFYDDEEFI